MKTYSKSNKIINASFIFIMLALIIMVGCKKNVVDVNKNFIGTWSGPTGECCHEIYIDSDGNGKYSVPGGNSRECNYGVRFTGKARTGNGN